MRSTTNWRRAGDETKCARAVELSAVINSTMPARSLRYGPGFAQCSADGFCTRCPPSPNVQRVQLRDHDAHVFLLGRCSTA